MSTHVACFGVVTSFKLHCRLGHSSLSLLNKLYPHFSNLSALNCEACQYAKLHHVHLSLRVNKRASALFELVHSNVWGPCPILCPTGFRHFVTFVDDFSRVTWLYPWTKISNMSANILAIYRILEVIDTILATESRLSKKSKKSLIFRQYIEKKLRYR